MRLRITFPSITLLRPVEIVAALPNAFTGAAGIPYRTVWALHCAMSDGSFFFEQLDASALVEQERIAFIAPSLGNGYFVNSPLERQADFLQEMFERLREVLPLSRQREDNLVLGISMGAFGALRWAMTNRNFGGAVGISGVFDCTLPPDARIRENRAQRALYATCSGLMRRLLLDGDGHMRDDADIAALAAHSSHPAIALYCGEGDYLSLSQTRHMEQLCRRHGHSVTLSITPGEHDERYWKQVLQDSVSRFFSACSS
ncbi:MAG: hypothetical protein J1E80_08995 [Desulfovibrionaceae bacterium]|nr:hypothetical protein [Desulfovibrionaceae bacterium]